MQLKCYFLFFISQGIWPYIEGVL